ncbi:MAG TPA: hypothetical protein VHU40_17170 [Polyangia bacterium]|nr:hypothetical protein [Polyangia bacterium]
MPLFLDILCRRATWLLPGSIFAALVAIAPAAQAVQKITCVAAHEAAQELRQRNELEQARTHLAVCSDLDCPALVTEDCRAWLTEVDVQLNAATTVDSDADVPVSAAVEKVPESAPPRASVPLPAAPVPRCRPGNDPLASAPLRPASSRAPLVTGALATVALANAAYFGYRGLMEADQLKRTCSPGCDPAAVTPVRRMLLIADLSGVVGVSLGAMTAWLLWDRREREPTARVASPTGRRGQRISDPSWSAMAGFGSLGVQYGGRF